MKIDPLIELTERFADEYAINDNDIVAVVVAPEHEEQIEAAPRHIILSSRQQWLLSIAFVLCCSAYIIVAMLGV